MKILLENFQVRTGNRALAKEIGLEESEVLLTLEAAIQVDGIRRNGAMMIALGREHLAETFTWCTAAHAKKVLESLRDKNYVFIDDNTLLESDSMRWYSINWSQVKTLKGIVVMDDGEIEDAHEPKDSKRKVKPLGTNGFSQAHQALFGTFIKACDFRQELLTPRDRGEIGSSVKKLIAMYAGKPVEIEEIQRAVLGFRVYWIEEGKKFKTVRSAPRPYTIISNWGKFETAVKQAGAMPEIPEEWL